eukprot:gene10927-11082_t
MVNSALRPVKGGKLRRHSSVNYKQSGAINGDVLDLKRELYDLKQQLNDRKEFNVKLHTENQRLRRQVAELESRLLDSTVDAGCPLPQNRRSSSKPGGQAVPQSSAAAFTGRVTAVQPARNAAFGQSSALRAFKNALVTCLQDEHEQLETSLQQSRARHQQQLQQLTEDHNSQLGTLQQHLLDVKAQTASEAAGTRHQHQSQIQSLQSILQQLADVEEHVLHPGWASDVVWVSEKSLSLAGAADAANNDSMDHQHATCTPSTAAAGTAAMGHRNPEDQVLSAASSMLELQLLLHSMVSQPSLLGVRTQDWWPLILVYAVGMKPGSSSSSRGTKQLLAAITGYLPGAASVAAGGAGSSLSETHKSAMVGTWNLLLLQHELRLQVRHPGMQAISWLQTSEMQLCLQNAQSACIGAFKVSLKVRAAAHHAGAASQAKPETAGIGAARGAPPAGAARGADESEVLDEGSSATTVLALLLQPSDGYWCVGLYAMTSNGLPGHFLGIWGQCCQQGGGADTCSLHNPQNCGVKTSMHTSCTPCNGMSLLYSGRAELDGIPGEPLEMPSGCRLAPGEVLVCAGLIVGVAWIRAELVFQIKESSDDSWISDSSLMMKKRDALILPSIIIVIMVKVTGG